MRLTHACFLDRISSSLIHHRIAASAWKPTGLGDECEIRLVQLRRVMLVGLLRGSLLVLLMYMTGLDVTDRDVLRKADIYAWS